MECPVIKYLPNDFIVVESLTLPLHQKCDNARFVYFRLVKSGFTTFEAIQAFASYFCIDQDTISYAGLKDEDAITEQLIAISNDADILDSELSKFNQHYRLNPSKEIKVGRLNGNSFYLTVRNLSESIIERLRHFSRKIYYFLNYYDTQRFGTSNGSKITHFIGQSLINGNEELALEYLRKAKLPESYRAVNFSGSGAVFFSNYIEKRVINFYKASYMSHIWNAKLAELVHDVCGSDAYRIYFETIPFSFTNKQDHVIKILSKKKDLDYIKYYDNKTVGRKPIVLLS